MNNSSLLSATSKEQCRGKTHIGIDKAEGRDHTILTYSGPGWKEVYELLPNGQKKLLWTETRDDRRPNLNDATALQITETLTWEEFCKGYRDNPSYSQ